MKLFSRILTGLLLLGIVSLFILYADGLLLSFFLLLILMLNALEWQALLRMRIDFFRNSLSSVFLLLLLLMGLFWLPDNTISRNPVVLIILILAVLLPLCLEVLLYASHKEDYLPRKLLSMISFFVIPVLFYVCALFIHSTSAAFALLVFFMLCFIDIGGYVCGKLIGGKRLCPRISPHKTYAGLLGGVLFCYAAYALLVSYSPLALPPLAKKNIFILAILPVALLTQFGDLYQSILKREVSVKDSGALLPGHGGLFDRIDNMLFGVPLFCALMILAR